MRIFMKAQSTSRFRNYKYLNTYKLQSEKQKAIIYKINYHRKVQP